MSESTQSQSGIMQAEKERERESARVGRRRSAPRNTEMNGKKYVCIYSIGKQARKEAPGKKVAHHHVHRIFVTIM